MHIKKFYLFDDFSRLNRKIVLAMLLGVAVWFAAYLPWTLSNVIYTGNVEWDMFVRLSISGICLL